MAEEAAAYGQADLRAAKSRARVATRRIGGKILIPTSAVRRFAREDHTESVRAAGVHTPSNVPLARFAPQSETNDDVAPMRASGNR